MNKYSNIPASVRKISILKIVKAGGIFSQEELRTKLKELGIEVAQATLSRDIKDIGLVKGPAGYLAPSEGYLAPGSNGDTSTSVPATSEKLDRVLKESVLSIETAGTIVVIKTPPAEAQTVARLIDQCGVEGSMGTIAGDDTIFLAVGNVDNAQAVRGLLLSRAGMATNAPSPVNQSR